MSPSSRVDQDGKLEALTQSVLSSAKYRHISPELIRRIGGHELAHRRKLRDAIKATKNKLHQVGGAYVGPKPGYLHALPELRDAAASVDEESLRRRCRALMSDHVSTRERLPILDEFYATTLAGLPPIRSMVDVACGLNPLALPWMGLDSGTSYFAYDIYADMMAFIQEFFSITGVKGTAEVRDVLGDPPTQYADLGLVLKSFPCLEQLEKLAAASLVDALNVAYLLISYPIQSLGGRDKGMRAHYENQFEALAQGRQWRVKRFEFETELAFLVETGIEPQ